MATTSTTKMVTGTKDRIARREHGVWIQGGPGGHRNGHRGPGGNDGGPRGGNGGGDSNDSARDWSGEQYRIGMWVALASILMLFTALTSAYIVRMGLSDDWQPIMMPSLLWLSTILIVMSSITFEVARRRLRRGNNQAYIRWLILTLALGLAFLATQLMAWQQLVRQGIYLASNPHSSFFYLLTGLHALHLIGGIMALSYLLFRAWNRPADGEVPAKRRTGADVVTLYWHFMDGLWVYLFGLLFLWR